MFSDQALQLQDKQSEKKERMENKLKQLNRELSRKNEM